MKYCLECADPAVYVIQWGSKVDQKEYSCADCLSGVLQRISAIEFFVVKVGRIDP